jgi:predicted SnoaL-like aldol condensation-catalyzing enzyme
MQWILKTVGTLIALAMSLMFITSCVQQKNDTAQEAKNIEVVMEMFKEVAEKKDSDKIDNYFAPNFVIVSNTTERNLSEFKKHLDEAFANSSSINISDVADIFAQGDKVVERYTMVVTDKKNNKQVLEGIAIFQLKDNKIIKWWDVSIAKDHKKKH